MEAFVPYSLPPTPLLKWKLEDRDLHERALVSLGRLDGIVQFLPNLELFLHMYVRKEAVRSSQIEGTQSSLSDFLPYEHKESQGVPIEAVTEVSNYVAVFEHGLRRLKE